METQTLMLYILILINQIISYGLLFYLAMRGNGDVISGNASVEKPAKPNKKKSESEEKEDTSGKYLDYINKFEVEA
ncbi:MAG: hypothetical protein R3Y32_03565 [Bacillota bacterium]